MLTSSHHGISRPFAKLASRNVTCGSPSRVGVWSSGSHSPAERSYGGAHAESPDFYIVGNSVQVAAMASIYGMAMSIANERSFGTLGPLLATPANRAAVFLGRGLPVLANGLFVSLFTFLAGAVFLGFRPGLSPSPHSWPSSSSRPPPARRSG